MDHSREWSAEHRVLFLIVLPGATVCFNGGLGEEALDWCEQVVAATGAVDEADVFVEGLE